MFHTSTPCPATKSGSAFYSRLTRGLRVPSRRFAVLLLGLCAISYGAGVVTTSTTKAFKENQFAGAYNSWVGLRERDLKSGGTGADTIKLWRVVKARFKDLDKSLSY